MLKNEFCEKMGIETPIVLAGMGKVANAPLAAAVSNAGGLGCIGGVFKTPVQIQADIDELKNLMRPGLPWAMDILLPKVGGNSRKTNSDYTKGKLGEIVDILCKEKPTLFVSAVGVPPRWVVERLHEAGVIVANIIGAPKHAHKALEVGCDVIICQGGEGGGHTGTMAGYVLHPMVVDICKSKKSPLLGTKVFVIAAGAICDGRSMAMALNAGCDAVWVGTRFVNSVESGATPYHQKLIVESDGANIIRSTVFTGRPLHMISSPYAVEWETTRLEEKKKLESQGIVAYGHDISMAGKAGKPFDMARTFPNLAGQCSGRIHDVLPAGEIVKQMTEECCQTLLKSAALVKTKPSSSSSASQARL